MGSEALNQVMQFGKDLNLVEPERGQEISWRQAGPSKRVDADERTGLAEVFRRWVTDPARYTEVAETLAAVVSEYSDTTAGSDGWKAIAD